MNSHSPLLLRKETFSAHDSKPIRRVLTIISTCNILPIAGQVGCESLEAFVTSSVCLVVEMNVFRIRRFVPVVSAVFRLTSVLTIDIRKSI